MKLIDWYITRKFLGTFIFTVLLFSLVSVVIDISEHLDDFLEKQAPFKLILTEYYVNFIPHIVFMLSPLFIFIAVIFFTSQMAYRSEIVAILASGVSFYRIMLVPYLACALILLAVQIYANHFLVPNSNRRMIEFEMEYLKRAYSNRDRNIHMQIEPNTFVYLYNYRTSDSSGRHFTLEHFDQQRLQSKLSATSVKWDGKTEKWKLNDYRLRTINGVKETLEMGDKMDTTINLHPQDFDQRTDFKEMMTTPDLIEFTEKEKLKGSPNIAFYEVEKHRRTAIPFATIILTFIGFSVASRKVRGGMGYHIFIGIVISAAYILFLQFSTTFATKSDLSPLLSVWIPNFIFAIVCAVLVWQAPK